MYYFTDNGKFIIENYNWETSFSNFLPGIAGKYGVPMWLYYVSRNQCVSSFGIRDKNSQIMEFLSFNKALEFVGLQGFRTFIKSNGEYYEPFKKQKRSGIEQSMTVSSAELEIYEKNRYLGLDFSVEYFTLSGENFPALIRILKIKNAYGGDKNIEFLDGMPRVIPFGMDQRHIHPIARHIEGMIEVVFKNGIPLYRLKQSPDDVEKVEYIDGGYFYMSLNDEISPTKNNYFADPAVIFQDSEIYDTPWNFQSMSLDELSSMKQVLSNKTPSAFTGGKKALKEGEELLLCSIIGYAKKDTTIPKIVKRIKSKGFIEEKKKENITIIEGIKKLSFTISSDQKFDAYCEQTFLDNVIRGGLPEIFTLSDGTNSAFYMYSRQNGDLERDYHFFIVEPTYYSQGTGHYRSVNQNRRADVYFFPEVRDRNIATFMNLIQTDGYDPLEITQMTYTILNMEGANKWLNKLTENNDIRKKIKELISRPFDPGEFLMLLEENKIADRKSFDIRLRELLSFAKENEQGSIHEGYWVDHWLYNLDLIDMYLMIYPDKLKELMLDYKGYYFYDDPDIVQPRDKKFVLVDGKIYQYNSVVRDDKKKEMIEARSSNPGMMRVKYGKGKIYKTNLLVKMLVLVVNRLATLDPFGIGIEMEADKPGWNDSMNGLPGIIGSSLCQTLELEKALLMLSNIIGKIIAVSNPKKKLTVKIYKELSDFMIELQDLIHIRLTSNKDDRAFEYWDKSHTVKEYYRKKTIYGIAGTEVATQLTDVKQFIDDGLNLVRMIFDKENKDKVFNKSGVPYTYYQNIVTEYSILKDNNGNVLKNSSGYPLVKAKKFSFKPLSLFLEGPVHMMKVHPELAQSVYTAVRKSGMYDKKLKMYKVCESLKDAPFEIGRVKAWGPGWIENESVYTHMEFKYILEIIRSGLYKEFYKDIKTILMPYLKPEIYKRSIIENVSFIVSSAFPDKKEHGRGLQPRLSGVTGEMINIWILMTGGKQVFSLNEKNELVFRLSPILEGAMFTKQALKKRFISINGKETYLFLQKNTFTFLLFGRTIVTYINNKRKNTFGNACVSVKSYLLYFKDQSSMVMNGPEIIGPEAEYIRQGSVTRMIVTLE